MENKQWTLSVFVVVTVCLVTVFGNSYEAGSIIIDGDDNIQPTTYKGKYPKNADETWLLSQDSGIWGLVFRQLSIEPSTNCRYDYLEIREPWNGTEVVPPTRYCGERTPLPYISQSPQVHIRFRSDGMWEMSGFWIQAVHSTNKELLTEKMESQSAEHYRPQAYSYRGDADTVDLPSKGPLFFVLIGASSAGLIVFTFLLIYFVIAMRRRRNEVQSTAPDQYYVNQPTGNRAQAPPIGSNGLSSSQVTVSMNNGRKYSRDKSTNQMKNVTSGEKTFPKTVVVSQSRTHHNNVYVLNNHTDRV